MNTEMGEYLVGAWLKEIKQCDFIQYNARLPKGHLPGLAEVDVIGLDLKNKIAYHCALWDLSKHCKEDSRQV